MKLAESTDSYLTRIKKPCIMIDKELLLLKSYLLELLINNRYTHKEKKQCSDSDMPIMAQAAEVLEQFGIDFEMTIISAHREPDTFFEYAKSAESKGMKVIIAGAGKAAHLPGMCAAIFPLPVIGIPMKTSDLGGVDSLYSIVQMPSGIPVATVAINGGKNAGILAAKILAASDPELLEKLKAYSEKMKTEVESKAEKLDKIGYKEYLASMKK